MRFVYILNSFMNLNETLLFVMGGGLASSEQLET